MIETERLILRRWEDRDRAPFHELCADPRVMIHIATVQSRAESDAAIDRNLSLIDRKGYAFWALERRDDGAFLGFCGIRPGPDNTPLEGEMEIGWRLAAEFWGKGYARESAQASLDHAWSVIRSPRVMAITVSANTRSWGLMERLRMTRVQGGDFDYPGARADSPIRSCITYSISRPEGR